MLFPSPYFVSLLITRNETKSGVSRVYKNFETNLILSFSAQYNQPLHEAGIEFLKILSKKWVKVQTNGNVVLQS